jgi:hypothetical protein
MKALVPVSARKRQIIPICSALFVKSRPVTERFQHCQQEHNYRGVVLAHVPEVSNGLLASLAHSGVDFFFVISSFIMGLIAGDKFSRPEALKD